MALDPDVRRRADACILDRLTERLLAEAPGVLALYHPIRGEVDPAPLAQRLAATGWRFALPVIVTRAGPLRFREWHEGAALVPGIGGIPVPETGAWLDPTVILAPLVGFDAALYRLGYGGGYFDRTLAALDPRPLVIGVGYELGRLASIDPEPHDRPMDAIVTEAGLVTAP